MTEHEYFHVPLVIYVDGVRHIVGEATIRGDEVYGAINTNDEEGQKFMDFLGTPGASFSMDYVREDAPRRWAVRSKEVPDLSQIKIPPNVLDRLELTYKDPDWLTNLNKDNGFT